MNIKKKSLPLGKDVTISSVIFGAASFGDVYGKVDLREKQEVVHKAYSYGINTFDTSAFYGGGVSESILGDILQDFPRSDVTICTKTGRSASTTGSGSGGGFDFTRQGLELQVKQNLARLKVQYIDCLALHDIEFGDYDVIINEALPYLQHLKSQGVIKAYGVSGYPHGLLSKICLEQAEKNTPLDYMISYNHCTLQNTTIQNLVESTQHTGTAIFEASPLGLGYFTDLPMQDWLQFPSQMLRVRAEAQGLCKPHQVTLSSVGLYYHFTQNTGFASVIGCKTVAELEETMRIYKISQSTNKNKSNSNSNSTTSTNTNTTTTTEMTLSSSLPKEVDMYDALSTSITNMYADLPHHGGKRNEEWKNHSGLPLYYEYDGHEAWVDEKEHNCEQTNEEGNTE